MNTTSQLTGAFRSALAHPARGVVDLVDDLLRSCPEPGLRLDWHADRCRIRPHAGGPDEEIDGPLRKSAFRAILARVAALCNERSPHSVSPYGGQGEASVGDNPPTVIRVSFVNTPGEQWLDLAPARTEPPLPASDNAGS
jgi:hypothetical protein